MSIKQKLLLASLFAVPTAAQAHQGHHSETASFDLVEHALSSPFHIGLIGGAIMVAFAIYRFAKLIGSKSNEAVQSKLIAKSDKGSSN